MIKGIAGFFCAIVLMVGTLHAQDITGTWQGTLKVGKDLRTVVKFSKDDNGGWKGNFYSLDQGGQALALNKIVVRDGSVKFSIPQLGGEYAGAFSANAGADATITGNWSQGPNPLPLVLTRVKPAAEWAIPEPAAKIAPMAADADPVFEVATIKPSKPEQQGKGFMMRGRRFSTINTSLIDLICFSYDLQQKEVLALPAWAGTAYDLDAQPDLPGTPSQRQLKSMVRKLLADRFKLTFHHEKKELPVYAITIAKGGPKLTASQSTDSGLPGLFFRGLGNMVNTNATISDFAGVMQQAVLDRPVVDQTGLTGHYDFTLNWTPDESQFGGMGIKVPPPSDKADAPPGLFTAIQEQIGLKLDATKAPVDAFVVDHVEKPSEN